MGMSIMPCRPALERLPDTVDELRYLATPRPDDGGSPCSGTLADFRAAAGRLVDVLAPALPGIAPAPVVMPALDAMQAADMALRADYNRLRDYRTRPMLAEGDALYQSLCICRDVRDALDEATDAAAARYEGAILQALEPALDAIIRAERLEDELAGREELVAIADEEIAAAEARARAIISDWRRPNTMPALRAVLARRNRSYLLDA